MTVQTEQSKAHAQRIDELSQIVDAYNRVTENLQRSHDTLTAEVQRLQDQLATANAALERSRRLAALGEMAAGIAHEVRNPLASIQLYARMLDEDLAEQPAQRDIARKIADAVRGLDGIVGDVLTYARQVRLKPAACEVAPLFDRALEAIRPLSDAADVIARCELDDETITAVCDAELMHQALVNLMRNAAQAMQHNDGERALTLSATREGDATLLHIQDTGPGIDQAAIDRIFNPFFTTRETGTGLGLAIVHRIVDAHGGTIAVSNHPSRGGAVFTLSLPDHHEVDSHE